MTHGHGPTLTDGMSSIGEEEPGVDVTSSESWKFNGQQPLVNGTNPPAENAMKSPEKAS